MAQKHLRTARVKKKSTMRIDGMPADGQVGTSTIRGFAQKKLAEKFGTMPNNEFDETISGGAEKLTPAQRRMRDLMATVKPGHGLPDSNPVRDPGKTMRAAETTRRLQALGRLPVGKMNGTESAYARHLDLLRHAGEILWYRFEGLKLRLADNTFLTPDFVVQGANLEIFFVDVKGAKAIVTDDAHVKMKVAAEQYPFAFKYAFPNTKGRSGWIEEEV